MKLHELTTMYDQSGEYISAVRFVVADEADPAARKVWIEGQVETEIRATRNHAALCSEVLEKARDELDQLRGHYRHLADQAMR